MSIEEYQSIIERAFDLILSPKVSNVDELKRVLENFIPDTEDYNDVLADQAQCAAIAMMYALEYLATKDIEMAFYVLQKLSEAIEIYESETGSQAEITEGENKWQVELIAKLGSIQDLSMVQVYELRQQNQQHILPVV